MKTINGLKLTTPELERGIKDWGSLFRVCVPRHSLTTRENRGRGDESSLRAEKLTIMVWLRDHSIRPIPWTGPEGEYQFLPYANDNTHTWSCWLVNFRSLSEATLFYLRWSD